EKAEGRTRDSAGQIRAAIGDVVEAATQRFASATEELRKTAGNIRTELEDTRAEIKRGVMQLPEETRESTSAMRRAVSEQINALKELSDIVARSGRVIDVADNRATARPAPAPAARTVTETPRAAPVAAPVAPRPAAAAQPRPQEPASPKAAQEAPAGGWVRDLLRGASREDAAPAQPRQPASTRSPLHVVESLNSLSVDIARAIDHEAAVELWNRYRRGERDVFTRRLYTLKGQQTFDDIRRKYQAEAEFRAAVDRYCEDFEKRLKDEIG